MKHLNQQDITQVSGGKFKKDDAVLAAIDLTTVYYAQNPDVRPSQDEVLSTVDYFYQALKDAY